MIQERDLFLTIVIIFQTEAEARQHLTMKKRVPKMGLHAVATTKAPLKKAAQPRIKRRQVGGIYCLLVLRHFYF